MDAWESVINKEEFYRGGIGHPVPGGRLRLSRCAITVHIHENHITDNPVYTL